MIVIHHNPACGTSRNVVEIVVSAGYVPVIIPYLDTGWTRGQLLGLFAAAGITPRQALREKGSSAQDLGLLDATVDDDSLLNTMVREPILVNRPLVCTAKGVRLCRPSERVFDLLDRLPPGPFRKEDGTLMIDAAGQRMV